MLIFFEGLAVWFAVVLVSMLIVAFLARRWGHDPFGWLYLAAAIGPFAIIGLVGTRHKEQDIARAPAVASSRRPGSVVIACDGSESNARAAAYATGAFAGADVVLLAVQPHEAAPRTPEEETAEATTLGELTQHARRAIEALGGHADAKLLYGNAGEEIVRFAEREQAAAIVVGRRGAGLSRAVLGSVSDHVVRNAKQPVVVIS